MGLYEYIIGLLTLVSGLALTEIALRISRLIEYRRTVRWDVQPLLCAILGISVLVINWANGWRADNSMHATIGSFVLSLSVTLMMYLMIAMALPSDPHQETDLGAFYEEQAGAFWSLFTLDLAQWIARYIFMPAIAGEAVPPLFLMLSVVTLALGAALIFWRNRAFNIAATIVLILIVLGPSLFEPF